MEEKKQNEKMSYDDLKNALGDMSVQYQKAVNHIRMLEERLEQADFSRASFLLQSMFQVMNHAELYDEKFVDWCKENIQAAITSFYEQSLPEEPEQKKDETK